MRVCVRGWLPGGLLLWRVARGWRLATPPRPPGLCVCVCVQAGQLRAGCLAALAGLAGTHICPPCAGCHAVPRRVQKAERLGGGVDGLPAAAEGQEGVEEALVNSLRTVGEEYVGIKHTQVRASHPPRPCGRLSLAAPPCQAAVLPRRLARRGPVLRPVVRGAARGRPRHSQPLSAATRHPHTHRRRRPMPMCRLPARRLWLRWLPPPPTWCLTSRRYGGWMPRGRAPWAWCTGKQGGLCVYACVWTGERSRGCLVAQRSSRAGPGWYLGLQCTVWHVPTPSCSQNPSSATTHTHKQTHTHAHNHFPASPCSPQRPGAARRGAGGDGRRPPRHPPAAAGARPATAAAAAVLAAGAGAADDGRCVCGCGWWWWEGCLPACLPGTQPRPAYV